MSTVAVVAHRGKSLGRGLRQLRSVLADHGITEPLWYECPRARRPPSRPGAPSTRRRPGVRMGRRRHGAALRAGAVLPPPWPSLPAGTANLLATNLGVPQDLAAAVEIGLHGRRRALDVGVVNGERFVVMAGTGFNALMIRDASRQAKDRFGRAAYLWTGARNLRRSRFGVRVIVDSRRWFKGEAGCVLLGNVGRIIGGLPAFDDAKPDDGLLEVGVVTARTLVQWLRVGADDHRPFGPLVAGRHHLRSRDRRPSRPGPALRAGRRRPQADQAAER